MIISRTPFRVPLGGGGTDLPFYYTKKGGALTSASINKYMYIIIQDRNLYNDFFIRYMKNPIQITSVADIPAQTGLGSSSSFLVGLLHALHAYKGERVSKRTLADEATQIQMEILRTPAGLQDQYVAAFGGLVSMNINKQGKVMISPLDIPNHHIKALEKNLVFMYTGINRSADVILEAQKKEAESDEEKIEGLTQ